MDANSSHLEAKPSPRRSGAPRRDLDARDLAGAGCQGPDGTSTSDTGGSGTEKPALLVGNTRGDSISLCDQESGAYLREFVPAGSGGLKDPDFMLLHDDGFLYVSSGREPDDSAILR